MDTPHSIIDEAQPLTADLRARPSNLWRVMWTVIAVASPFGAVWYAASSGVSWQSGVLASMLLELIAVPMTVLAHRSEFRADQDQILTRGFVTRRIPVEHIEQILFAYETEYGGFLPFRRTKIEIIGDGARLLYFGPSNRVKPILDYLERRFPHLVEQADSLPDA